MYSGIVRAEDFLQEVSAASVCGEDLEYDADFQAMERAAAGKPEVQFGNVVTPEAAPDWLQVQQLALGLLHRSRDLRVALRLTISQLKLDGYRGFAAGLSLIEQLLVQRWDSVHPQPDPADPVDPTRTNILAQLLDPAGVLRHVRESKLVSSPRCGRYSLRDIDIANGELAPSGDEARPSLAMIDAAFLDSNPAAVQATLAALEQAHASVLRIEAALTERVGAGLALDLSALSSLLRRARDFVQARCAAVSASADGVEAAAAAAASVPATTIAAAPPAASGEIRSREDVQRLLGKICAWYAQNEPSSPIPLLLLRAQRLVDKSFLEILQDLAPEGLTQIHVISGSDGAS